MKDRGERLEAFRDAVMDQAQAEADWILEEGRRETRRILSRAESEVEAEAKTLVERAQRQADTVVETARAEAELDAQALKLRRREALLQDVLETAKERLRTELDAEDYPDVVERLVREAVANLGETDTWIVHGDSTALAILREGLIGGLSSDLGCSLTLGDALEQGVGVIVEGPDGHNRYNNTLNERLDRQWENLRGPVYRILRGEGG
jgi:vacuolar-type H+-ATPase subunit E/Vma4